MDAFGKKLTEARISRGLDFDQIARETNIARRYLEALEQEDFSVFPGEPYLLGFLRNYSEYLSLNSNEMIAAYKNFKIQESPVPLKELIPSRPMFEHIFSNRIFSRVLITILILAVLTGIVLGGIKIGSSMLARQEVSEVIVEREAVTHEISTKEFGERIHAGDILSVSVPSGTYRVSVIATAPSLKLDTPLGVRLIELGQDILIDLSGDDTPDMQVFVADLFKNDPSKGADVRISAGSSLVLASPIDGGTTVSATDSSDVVVLTEQAASSNSKYLVLFEGGSAYPVTMNATFRGYCLFRYESDRTNREERYYQKSELLTVQANNGIRIWASNGNAVKIQMIAGGKTVDLEISRPGEIIVRDLKWIKDDETGRFKFIVMDID